MRGVIHWTARGIAATALLFVSVLAIGEVFSTGQRTLPLSMQDYCMIAAFVLMAAGLIVGFHHERLGGWLTVVSMALFYGLAYFFTDSLPRGPFFAILFGLPALVYLISGDNYDETPRQITRRHMHSRA